MARIYGDAYVTIVASSASCASEGFLKPRQARKEELLLPFRVSQEKFGIVGAQIHRDPRYFEKRGYQCKEPIDERAWTLQEQLLGNRLLLYTTHTLRWRCAATTVNVDRSLNVPMQTPEWDALFTCPISQDPRKAYAEWTELLEEYTTRKATVKEDRLPAIAAMVERFEPILGPYHAGLWEKTLIADLSWAQRLPVKVQRNNTRCVAPSWSWASCEGRIEFVLHPRTIKPLATLLSWSIRLKNECVPYGEVVRGSITIRARLLSAYITVPKSECNNWEPATMVCSARVACISTRPPSNSAIELTKTIPLSIQLDVREKVHESGQVCKLRSIIPLGKVTRRTCY
jgi:hypothetical protein